MMKRFPSFSSSVYSPLIENIEKSLYIPTDADYMQTPPAVVTQFVDDFSVLSCGCLISEQFAKQLAVPLQIFNCPTCLTPEVRLLGPVPQLRHLANILKSIKLDSLNADAISETSNDDASKKLHGRSSGRRRSSSKKSLGTGVPTPNKSGSTNGNISLLSAFHDILNEINTSNVTSTPPVGSTLNTSGGRHSSSITSSTSEFSKSPTTQYNKNNNKASNDNFNGMRLTKLEHSGSVGTNSTNESTVDVTGSPTTPPLPFDKQAQDIFKAPSGSLSNLTKGLQSSLPSSNNISSSPTDTVHKLMTNGSSSKKISKDKDKDLNKELFYAKNFPFYRKIYQYNTHSSKFFLRKGASKNFINSSISPDLTKIVLLSEKKWEVFQIDPERPDVPPKLFCCGDNKCTYGPDFENLKTCTADEISIKSNIEKNSDNFGMLQSWEHLFVKVKNNLLVISGTMGFLQVHDLNKNGKILYTYQSKFPIRCFDISDDENIIAIGVTGKDKYTGVEQPFIILLRLEFMSIDEPGMEVVLDGGLSTTTGTIDGTVLAGTTNQHPNDFGIDPLYDDTSPFEGILNPITSITQCDIDSDKVLNITTFPFALPYRDPVNVLQFSPSCKFLVCSTALESRFVAIDVTDLRRPCLVMKSQRNLDTSLESEGITDIQFFPDNRTMTLTSVAYNTVPIIIDSKITKINGPEGVARPRLVAKVEEIGNNTHKACISPRGDSIAYLDRNGSVYVLTAPRMNENDNKRIVLLTTVASAYRARESASMRFDKNGYKLFILDRKGVLTIADFAAGTTEDHSITRSKLIS